MEGGIAKSFAVDCGWPVVADSVAQLCQPLQRAGIKLVEWENPNYVTFKNSNDNILVFIRGQKLNPKRRLSEDKITIRGHTLGFSIVVTR